MNKTPSPCDVLYRYISNETFAKRFGYPHPDPLFEEFSYGEGYNFASLLWNNVDKGSRLFFHTTIGSVRYITAMFIVAEMAPGAVWRQDEKYFKRYNNPHFRPERYQENAAEAIQHDLEVVKVWEQGQYPVSDVIILGDPETSLDIRNEPIVLSREILSNLDMLGKPIKWDICDKHGNVFDEKKCVNSCLRTPRLLSEKDGDYLESLVKERLSAISGDAENYVSLGSKASAEILASCISEDDIEQYIIKNLGVIDKNLRFVGNQIVLSDHNRLDILAKYDNGNFVIIEVKKGTASDDTLTQLLAYLNQYKKENSANSLSGRIVCQDASYRLKNACEHLNVKIHYYGDMLFKKE